MHHDAQRWPLPLQIAQKTFGRGTAQAPLSYEHLQVSAEGWRVSRLPEPGASEPT
jgi:hypothetical protein